MYNNRRIRNNIFVIIFLILGISIFSSVYMYFQNYYHANEAVYTAIQNKDTYIVEKNDGSVVFLPDGAKTGIIFYPGAKVEYTSYSPLLSKLAANGILCILLEMPQNFAVFDIDAANGWMDKFPEIDKWYMAGHSLGGAMSAVYTSNNIDKIDGLILLAAYSTADLSKTDLDVILIYGTCDEVLNKEKYEANKSNLPDDYVEYVIEGGCHAYFGNYGEQAGDGVATISLEEQQRQTVEAILANIK